MKVQAHTTPESRQALKDYLRNRRMSSSIHLTMAALALSDLEEALHLLRGIEHPNATWADEVDRFLVMCSACPSHDLASRLPGLLEGA